MDRGRQSARSIEAALGVGSPVWICAQRQTGDVEANTPRVLLTAPPLDSQLPCCPDGCHWGSVGWLVLESPEYWGSQHCLTHTFRQIETCYLGSWRTDISCQCPWLWSWGRAAFCVQPALLVGSFGRAQHGGTPRWRSRGATWLARMSWWKCQCGSSLSPSGRSMGAAHHPIDEAIPWVLSDELHHTDWLSHPLQPLHWLGQVSQFLASVGTLNNGVHAELYHLHVVSVLKDADGSCLHQELAHTHQAYSVPPGHIPDVLYIMLDRFLMAGGLMALLVSQLMPGLEKYTAWIIVSRSLPSGENTPWSKVGRKVKLWAWKRPEYSTGIEWHLQRAVTSQGRG